MDHLRIIFALESRLKKNQIPNEFEEVLQRFEDKKETKRNKRFVSLLRIFKRKKTGRTSRL